MDQSGARRQFVKAAAAAIATRSSRFWAPMIASISASSAWEDAATITSDSIRQLDAGVPHRRGCATSTRRRGSAPSLECARRKAISRKSTPTCGRCSSPRTSTRSLSPLPNHWHALAAIWACQAGKDVYVEKPASHNMFEGQQMVEAARKYNRMVQVGSQSRSHAAQDAGHAAAARGRDRTGVSRARAYASGGASRSATRRTSRCPPGSIGTSSSGRRR